MKLSKVQKRKMLARGEELPKEYQKQEELPWSPLYFPEKSSIGFIVPEQKERHRPPRDRSSRSFGNLKDYKYFHLEKSDEPQKEIILSALAQRKKERRALYEQKLKELRKDELDLKHIEHVEEDEEAIYEVELDELEKLKEDLDKSSDDLMKMIKKEMEDIKKNEFDLQLRPNKLLLHMPHAVREDNL